MDQVQLEEEERVQFKKEDIEEICRMHFDGRKPRADVTLTIAELVRIFVEEGCHRASEQASVQDSPEVTIEHFERILTQLLMDF